MITQRWNLYDTPRRVVPPFAAALAAVCRRFLCLFSSTFLFFARGTDVQNLSRKIVCDHIINNRSERMNSSDNVLSLVLMNREEGRWESRR